MSAKGGREAKEIEVTPEMIEAGMRELANYDPNNWSAEESAAVLTDIFRAMETKRQVSKVQ